MAKEIDYEHLEENILGVFFAFLEKGGVDVHSLEALAKVRHSTFDCALIAVCEKLFKTDRPLPDNRKSLLPYDDLSILEQLWDIYIKLCSMTDNDCTLNGFSRLTGINSETFDNWSMDELNPGRFAFFKSKVKERQHMIENKLSDTTIGLVALANNSKSLGMHWAENYKPTNNNITAYILPGEAARQALEQRMNTALPKMDGEKASTVNE